MRKGSAEALHLSVRLKQELAQQIKAKEEAEARIESIIQMGDVDLNKILDKGAKEIATFMKKTFKSLHIPSTMVRKTAAQAVHMAIPKSNRGRKPHEQVHTEHHEAA